MLLLLLTVVQGRLQCTGASTQADSVLDDFVKGSNHSLSSIRIGGTHFAAVLLFAISSSQTGCSGVHAPPLTAMSDYCNPLTCDPAAKLCWSTMSMTLTGPALLDLP